MSQRFRTGLVVGKFSPLHAGHRYLIETAKASCERLIVVSYSRPEYAGCTADLRRFWIQEEVPSGQCLTINAVEAIELGLEMPDNDASDRDQRQFCADLIDRCIGSVVDAVFSSEDYGRGFADFLSAHWGYTVRSVLVDRNRVNHPISGTILRNQPDEGWVSDLVFKSQTCKRIAFIGAESTGKTTLGQWIAQQRGCPWVAEFGRQYWHERGGQLSSSDLLTIARRQVQLEDQTVRNAVKSGQTSIICDTTPLTTLIYHKLMFEEPPPAELMALAERPYHELWFCSADFPMVQDGTRRSESFRQQQQRLYLSELNHRGIPHNTLSGPIELRKRHLNT